MDAIAERAFTPDDQRAFAALSGDANPMHMDAKAARRTQAGRPVVHGVHAVLWAMECVPDLLTGLSALSVRFDRMIYVGDRCRLRHGRRRGGAASLDVVVDDVIVLTVTVHCEVDEGRWPGDGRETAVGFASRAADFVGAFPRAAAALGADFLADLAGLSYLVGMIHPGLHSIFRGFTVARRVGGADTGMHYSVLAEDDRFNLVTMRVAASTLQGQVEAFRRAPPVAQPCPAELRELVRQGEFAQRSALVVGGSRGLGALTAKLLGLGGADVVVTYAVGDDDAREVADEIRAAGAVCDIMRLDVRRPIPVQMTTGTTFDQLYYFATPFIFGKRGRGLDRALLAEMMTFYVDGFYDLCAHLGRDRALHVFYPSSVAVAERPAGLTEYAMAKAAGEALCADLPRLLKGVNAKVRRLPRLRTDQTASVQPLETGSAIDEMLATIRALQP